jgi:hypothetical protein
MPPSRRHALAFGDNVRAAAPRIATRVDLLTADFAAAVHDSPDQAVSGPSRSELLRALLPDRRAGEELDEALRSSGTPAREVAHAVLLVWGLLGADLASRWASEPALILGGLTPAQWAHDGGDPHDVLLAARTFTGVPEGPDTTSRPGPTEKRNAS